MRILQLGSAPNMLSILRKLFTKNEKIVQSHKDATSDRRSAKRTQVPDTSGVKDISLPASNSKTGKQKKTKLPNEKAPKDMAVTLSGEAHKAEEQKTRQMLEKQLKAKESNSKGDPFGFSINLPTVSHDEVHQTIAVSLPELGVACIELKKAMRVKDISTTGIGLRFEKPRIKAGTKLTLILATKKAKLTTDLKAKVMRHEKGVLGASFHDLTRQQENLLAKLVLEGQKRQRALRKKRELPKDIQDLKL